MGPHASWIEIALSGFGTVLLGQFISNCLSSPNKGDAPKAALPPAEKPRAVISPEEDAETCRQLREDWPSLPAWLTAPPIPELLPPPKPSLPLSLKLTLSEDGGQCGRHRAAD